MLDKATIRRAFSAPNILEADDDMDSLVEKDKSSTEEQSTGKDFPVHGSKYLKNKEARKSQSTDELNNDGNNNKTRKRKFNGKKLRDMLCMKFRKWTSNFSLVEGHDDDNPLSKKTSKRPRTCEDIDNTKERECQNHELRKSANFKEHCGGLRAVIFGRVKLEELKSGSYQKF